MPNIVLSEKQTAKCLSIITEWCRCADERMSLPPILHVKLKLLRDMLADGDVLFTDEDFEFLGIFLLLYFQSFDEGDVDPLAEQAYAKVMGEWPILPPWYDRIVQFEAQVGFERDGQLPALGT